MIYIKRKGFLSQSAWLYFVLFVPNRGRPPPPPTHPTHPPYPAANIVSKALYGIMVAAKCLNFLAALTGVGLAMFVAAVWYLNTSTVTAAAGYYWLWWIVFAYYGLAVVSRRGG